MLITLKTNHEHAGKKYRPDDSADLPDADARYLISIGAAIEGKPPTKPRKPTKAQTTQE
ncbi:MAG: hypothetical protein IE913_03005 [Halothiobacillus sp.]|nr:hypothetical protein [Halothiobacillus sp.]